MPMADFPARLERRALFSASEDQNVIRITGLPREQRHQGEALSNGRLVLKSTIQVETLFIKNKRPGLIMSRGADVDQPSPKCCSITTIVQIALGVNGYWELRSGTNGLRYKDSYWRKHRALIARVQP